MDSIVVESFDELDVETIASPNWKQQVEGWRENMGRWRKEGTSCSPCQRKQHTHKANKVYSPCGKNKGAKVLSDELCRKKPQHSSRYSDCSFQPLPQSCISKPYINLADAMSLKDGVYEGVEVLTSPSAVFVEIEELLHHFPDLKAAYNIFIKVRESDAALIHDLDLNYALFVLDPMAPELTLTALLPHLRSDGYFVFFYCEGMIVLNHDIISVRGTDVPENLVKLVREPKAYPCKEGSWHEGVWKMYCVELNANQVKCMEKVSHDGIVEMEHVKISNCSELFYGDWQLRQTVESMATSLNSTEVPLFVLTGLNSVPSITSLFLVYAEEKGLLTDDCRIRVDCLLRSWLGDDIACNTISIPQLKEIILKHKSKPNDLHKLLFHDPTLIKAIKEEQKLFAHARPFTRQFAPFTPELLS